MAHQHLHQPPFQHSSGFTLIEMIVSLILVGILAIAVLPRLFDRGDFDARAFADQTASALRYAQKTAIAQRRTVCTVFTANSLTLRIRSTPGSGACDTNLTGPTGVTPYTVSATGTVLFSPTPSDFSFDAEGRPSSAATLQIGSVFTVMVQAETGYVSY